MPSTPLQNLAEHTPARPSPAKTLALAVVPGVSTSNTATGAVLPTPTLPPVSTSWDVPATRPLAGRLSAPVIVSPAFATYTVDPVAGAKAPDVNPFSLAAFTFVTLVPSPENVLAVMPPEKTLLPAASVGTLVVSRFSVTVPDVPPPVRSVPAVTPVMVPPPLPPGKV